MVGSLFAILIQSIASNGATSLSSDTQTAPLPPRPRSNSNPYPASQPDDRHLHLNRTHRFTLDINAGEDLFYLNSVISTCRLTSEPDAIQATYATSRACAKTVRVSRRETLMELRLARITRKRRYCRTNTLQKTSSSCSKSMNSKVVLPRSGSRGPRT